MGRQLFDEYRRSRKHGGPESEHDENGNVISRKLTTKEEEKNFEGDWYTHPAHTNKGAFPRMKHNNESGNYPNLNLSKAGFMALSMSQFFGFNNPIAMTSGERLGYDQWRVMKEYQYPQDMHLYPRELRKTVKDSVKVHGFDTEAGDNVVINYIEDIYEQYDQGLITEKQLRKKVGSHITGDAGDFTGQFRSWLTKGASRDFRKLFNIKPLNEGDHFHVPFNDISYDNIPEEYQAHWGHYSDMFDRLSHTTDRGKQRINMNPTAHTLTQLSGSPPMLPMIEISEIPSLDEEIQLQKANPLPDGFGTPKGKNLIQKIFGYRKFGGHTGDWRKLAKAEYGKAQEAPVDERALRDNVELITTTLTGASSSPLEEITSIKTADFTDPTEKNKQTFDWTGTTQGETDTKLTVNNFGWADLDFYREKKDDGQFIMNTQNFLIEKGFNIKPDGDWGNQTHKGINEYLTNQQLNNYSKTNFSEDQFYDQIYKESHGKNNTISPKGAMGIAQFMPATFTWAKKKGWIPNTAKITDQAAQSLAQRKYMDYLFEDRTNIKSAKTKEEQQARAFAAYNQGPDNFDKFWGTLTDAEKKGGWKTWYKKANNETSKYVLWMMDKETYKKDYSTPYTNKRGKITSKWNDVYYGYERWRSKNMIYRY